MNFLDHMPDLSKGREIKIEFGKKGALDIFVSLKEPQKNTLVETIR